jgi:hypothetical protein
MHVRRLHRVARLEGLLDHAAGLEVADAHAVEGLALARLDELVFDDGVGIAVEHDLESALEFVGAVESHVIACETEPDNVTAKDRRLSEPSMTAQ